MIGAKPVQESETERGGEQEHVLIVTVKRPGTNKKGAAAVH